MNIYSVEQLLNLTVADLQDPTFTDVVEIEEGYENLTQEVRQQCILKLRELKNQRDELAQSSTIDVNVLTDKLNQLERSRSVTPYDPNPWQPPDPEGDEKKAHQDLIKDHGRPCFPSELWSSVFDYPEQYKNIVEYWRTERSANNQILSSQLHRWEKFRYHQRRNRERYGRGGWFFKLLESLRERRRKYGLDGDLQLCEKVADQSELQDWMEYQNFELQHYERLEEGLKEYQQKLESNRKMLAEEGHSAFEEIEGLDEWGEMEEAEEKRKLAERKLRIAKTRLEAAQSEELGEMVERDHWIGWLANKVESRRSRMEELKGSADKAEQDVKPYDQWMRAKEDECRATDSEKYWTEEVQRLFEIEARTAEFRTKDRKREELRKRAREVGHARCCAKIELQIAEEGLKAARREDLAPTVQRAALIRRTQKEVRFAEFHLEEEEESEKVLRLKLGVIIALYEIPGWRQEIKRHRLLLDWTEQQRCELLEEQRRKVVGDGIDTGQERGPRRSTRISSKVSLCTTQAPPIDHHSVPKRSRQERTRQQKPTAKSILDPVHPAKIIKTSKRKWKRRSKTRVSHDISQLVEQTNVDSNFAESHTAESQSRTAMMPVEDGIRARLRPIHSL